MSEWKLTLFGKNNHSNQNKKVDKKTQMSGRVQLRWLPKHLFILSEQESTQRSGLWRAAAMGLLYWGPAWAHGDEKWDTGHVWDCGELKKETRSGSEAGSRKNFASTVAWMVVGSDRLLLFLMGTGLAAPWHLLVREGLIAPSLSAVQAKNILPWSSENIPDAFLLSPFLIINAQDESAAFLVDIHFLKNRCTPPKKHQPSSRSAEKDARAELTIGAFAINK